MNRNVKRILSLFLVIVFVMAFFAACEPKDPNAGTNDPAANFEGNVKLWYAYNTDNFMQDLEYEDLMEERDYTLRMHGVRDDVESIQLIVTPENNVVSYDFTVSDLKNENGDVFAASNIEVFAEYYIEVTQSYNNDAYYGFYPDALVPLEKYKALHHNSIDAGENQGIWLNANIPVDQAAGFYTGNGVLNLDGTEYNVPIELTVYDVTLPEENHWPSSYAIWYDHIVYGEGYYTAELAQEYFWFLVDKRIMPLDPDPSIKSNYDTYVDWLAETQMDNPKVSSYGLPYKAENYEGGRRISRASVMEMLTLMAEKTIALREAGDEDADLFKKAFYYLGGIVDEPTGTMLPMVRECDLIIQECKQEIANTYFKDKYPDLYRSCITINHVVTTGYNIELLGTETSGGVQTWCPQYQHYNSEAQREEYYARRDNNVRGEYGEELWWYGCNNPKVPFPTFHLDDDLISSRVKSWMEYDFEIVGDLYWCVNIYKTGDAWTIPAYTESVQEGRLTYPGAKYGIFGPLSTLRLESIRESREDYECLLMIGNAIEAYNQANGTNYDDQEIMDYLFDDLYDDIAVPIRDNAEVFYEQRVQMLEVLELITNDPAAGIEALLNG